MCGIAGAFTFGKNAFTVSETYIKNMTDALIHRGPDDSGIWISKDRKTGLGHRRLSIIDLSKAAAQPMGNEDGTLWVVYNGEIYNHTEIRTELEQIGSHKWKTDHSDTEVILHAFEQWGIECLKQFRGMFAIAIWNDKTKELWLIRDRIGVKPLYYSINHNRITFASEIKALLADPIQKRTVNEEALYHYLSFIATPAPQTLFNGIKKLSPGAWLRVRENGEIYEYRYWDVCAYTEPLVNISEEEIAQRLLSELRTAVKLRKVSDVPVGVFLSGGIDSSVNAKLFSEDESRPINTFSIGYDKEYLQYQNEFQYARMMAELVGASHHEKLLTENDFIDFLPKLVFHQDEPIADPVCMPVYHVSKLARDNGVIVCHVGEGSDELFCGYPSWTTYIKYQRLSNLFPEFFKVLSMNLFKKMGKEHKVRYEWLRRVSSGEPVFWGGVDAFTEAQKKKLLSGRMSTRFRDYSSFEVLKPIFNRFREKAWEQTPLNWMSYLDLNMRLPELLLMRVDKMSMAVSVEARVPFLDYKFVELSMSIPESVKIKDGELKHILKKAIGGIIPDDIIKRKKQGFNVPVHDWFFGRLGNFSRKKINDFNNRTDYFNSSYLETLFNNGKNNDLWYILNFILWHEKWIEQRDEESIEKLRS
jgi:asparagine synthase (glutamine-hydrolysing)